MQDPTTGPVIRHLLKTTSLMLVMMVFQTFYFLVDLYWMGRLGTEAVAGVGVAGNLTFIVMALTQMLGVGTTTVVSHAVGQKDHKRALLAFNQSQLLAIVTGVLFLIVGLIIRLPYSKAMAADPKTAAVTASFLAWFIPAMALQFAMVAMGAALRGVGNFKPGTVVATGSVVLNMVLAPFLIFGWVTGHPFGAAGAAMASLISIVVGIIWLSTYFYAKDSYLKFDRADQKPQMAIWKRILGIGFPAGLEFALMSVYMVIVYSITRRFGASAQAGFGIGQRVVQSGMMPVIALGFAVAPVAGQNFGARRAQRVKETFWKAATMAAVLMLIFALICHIAPDAMIRVFSKDPAVIAVGEEYLRIISWNLIASGLIFVISSMFQAMGNTIPSLFTSGLRIMLVAIPAILMSRMAGFQLHWIWYLSVGAVLVQLGVAFLLLQREFSRRLAFDELPAASAPTAPPVSGTVDLIAAE
jgi:putative MATE family efflux protein